jgi:hypothetical protein
MNKLKDFRIVIFVLITILILVVSRASDQQVFKERAVVAINESIDNKHWVSIDQLKNYVSPYVVIDLDGKVHQDTFNGQPSVSIPFGKLLDHDNRILLNKASGDIILKAEEAATASKAWVILNQLGYKRVKILSPENHFEELKYKFQPDTTARLENDAN